ncbi:hypothetical protein KOR34_26110 [Posidoniimonas corsicana]|uniref:DNA primase/polymerase bifunctional N-terminal domain-containing protein n=1 Tax=Posidoniimonas corsicana TaxID=1938618 RepID=A0A5C5VI13_9BACT|nr:bifunctional DNA primase/polymerase [Posidoniimonas corsicana]TWT37653.1 hypothetical protein KOR34_26110 [Posidoniimonas corsicana]
MRTQVSENLEAALDYAERGWRVIPCDVEKKHPPLKRWQELATCDPDQIAEWFEEKFPGAGVSLVFGPASGIVDIDVDNAEDGDKLCRLAFGGEWPATPTYLSGTKKTPHRLFRFSEELPSLANINLRDVGFDIDLKIGAIGKGSHSLAPPSRGYQWVPGLSPDDVEPAELPDSFLAWISNQVVGGGGVDEGPAAKSPDEWAEIFAGVDQGARNDSLTKVVGRGLRLLADPGSPDAIAYLVDQARAWNRQNHPPLDDDELVRTVRSIVGRENKRRAGQCVEADGFKIVIRQGDPCIYELHFPAMRDLPPGHVDLKSDQLYSGAKTRDALGDAGYFFQDARAFVKTWPQDILPDLLANAERRAADPSESRRAIIAQAVLSVISRQASHSRVFSEGEEPVPDGVSRYESGDMLISVSLIGEELRYHNDRPTRSEYVEVLREAGCSKVRPGSRSSDRRRYWRMTKRNLQKLEAIAWPA